MTLPYYPFKWADYSSKTWNLTQGQHGAFLLLMRWIYTEGTKIPHDERYSIARALLEQEQKNVDFVLQKYFVREGEFWSNSTCSEVMDEAHAAHQRRVNAGKKGGKAKLKHSYSKAQATKTKTKDIPKEGKPSLGSTRREKKPPRMGFDFTAGIFLNTNEAEVTKWIEAYPACDVRAEMLRAGAWLKANPTKRKSNYERFITMWLSRQQDKGGSYEKNIAGRTAAGPAGSHQAATATRGQPAGDRRSWDAAADATAERIRSGDFPA